MHKIVTSVMSSGSYLVAVDACGEEKRKVGFLRTSWFGQTVYPFKGIIPTKKLRHQNLAV